MPDTSNEFYERKMEKRNLSVVTIKNISDEDFTHSYGGFPYTIRAGETLPFTYPVAHHLAKHLAMKILRKKKQKERKFKDRRDETGKEINYYPPEEMKALISQIIVSQVEQPLAPVKTEAQLQKERIEQMQKEYKQQQQIKTPEVEKKDIIAELEKRGIKFNPRASKEELARILIENEMKGE